MSHEAEDQTGQGESTESPSPGLNRSFFTQKHPTRRLHVLINVTKTNDTRLVIHSQETLDLEPSDPLVTRVRSGVEAEETDITSELDTIEPTIRYELVNADDGLMENLLEGRSIPELQVARDEAHITTTDQGSALSPEAPSNEGEASAYYSLDLSVIAVTPPKIPSGPDISNPINTIDISVTAKGLTIAGLRGPPPIQQSSTSLTYHSAMPMAPVRAAVLSSNDDQGSVSDALDGWREERSTAEDNPVFIGSLAWTAAMLLPLAALLVITYRMSARITRKSRWLIVAAFAALGVLAGMLGFEVTVVQFMGIVGELVAVPLAVLFIDRKMHGHLPTRRLDALWCLLLPGAALSAYWLDATWLIVVALGGATLALTIVLAPKHWIRASALTLSWLASGALLSFLSVNDEMSVLGMVILGSLWSPVAAVVFGVVVSDTRWWTWLMALACGAMFLSRPSVVLDYWYQLDAGYPTASGSDVPGTIGTAAGLALPVLSALIAIGILTERGKSMAATTDPVAWMAGIVVILSAVVFPTDLLGDLLPAVLTVALMVWLTRVEASSSAARLANINRIVHARLVRLELRRRLLRDAERELFASSRPRLVDGTLDITELDTRRHRFESSAGSLATDAPGKLRVRDSAFSSGAGYQPSYNAIVSTYMGILLAAPIIAWELIQAKVNIPEDPLFYTLDTLRHAGRWAAYAAFFGFFYPRVRGRTPIVKASALLIGILPGELLWILAAEATTRDRVLAMVALAGQTALFSLGLGLFWEYRLMTAADLSWTLLRSVRSLRSLGVPITAVLVAAATAAATVLGGAAVEPLITPRPPVQTPASTSPTTLRTP